MTVAALPVTHPLTVAVGSTSRRSRRVAAARPLLALPVLALALLLNFGAAPATWAAVAVCGRAPAWLAHFQVAVVRWHAQATAYLLALTDRLPTAAEDHPVRISFAPAPHVARRKVLVWKLLTAIPHLGVLAVLSAGLLPAAVLGWLAVAATGRLPRALRAYDAGVVAYAARLAVYLQSLTDVFPPFSLRGAAPRTHRRTYVACAVMGLIPASFVTAVLVFIIGFSGTRAVVTIPYDGLRAGALDAPRTEAAVESGHMTLDAVRDPAALGPFAPRAGARFVAFELTISNWRGAGEGLPVEASSFRLEDSGGARRAPVLVGLDGTPGAGSVPSHRLGRGVVVFEVREGVRPRRLIWDVVDYIAVPRRGETIEWVLR